MTVNNAIEFLRELKYDDFNGERELSEYQTNYNNKLDNVIMLLYGLVERPDRLIDEDCPSGVCGTGGRV